MKKLKLTEISKSKIEKNQMKEIKGGKICAFSCTYNCPSGRGRSNNRRFNKTNEPQQMTP